MSFDLQSDFEPTGDQPQAIRELTEGIDRGDRHQTLLGATGTGKTFTVSHVINNVDRPVLVMSHNKTLAAQLYSELSQFFPENAVEYFISYYDYYQPEAYVPTTDTYIEKDASINDEIERMRLSATSSLVSGRDDVIVVSSVSAIYGLGSPTDYKNQIVQVKVGDRIERNDFLRGLVDILYERNDVDFSPGTFRVRGDAVEVLPAYFQDQAYQIEFWGDEIDRIRVVDPISGNVLSEEESVTIYPANHFVTPEEKLERAIDRIEEELKWRLAVLREEGKLVEAQRLEQRTLFDVEMMKEVGYCAGIENYARHLSGREQGERPYCLLDYFPEDYFVVIDESHVTVPQLRAMYNGDRQRKLTLVEHGFRLPSALDNRPLKFEEFQDLAPQTIYVSATPGDYELKQSGGVIVEQIVRPTGVLDPEVEVRPTEGQIDDLLDEIYERAQNEERTLVTTLTKRMAEDLTDYLRSYGVRVEYIHSDIDTVERVEILRNLRLGEYDVVVGVNLLREGLDLPEVSLVAIMDADKEGFLRSETSLIQTAGRAARNVNGTVVMYANRVTDAMQKMIDETERRREIQMEYNEEHDITPETIQKSVDQIKRGTAVADRKPSGRREEYAYTGPEDLPQEINDPVLDQLSDEKKREMIDQLEEEMHEAADQLAFERAAELRDTIDELKESLPEYEEESTEA